MLFITICRGTHVIADGKLAEVKIQRLPVSACAEIDIMRNIATTNNATIILSIIFFIETIRFYIFERD